MRVFRNYLWALMATFALAACMQALDVSSEGYKCEMRSDCTASQICYRQQCSRGCSILGAPDAATIEAGQRWQLSLEAIDFNGEKIFPIRVAQKPPISGYVFDGGGDFSFYPREKGIATHVGNYTFTVSAKDDAGCEASKSFPLVVTTSNPPVLRFLNTNGASAFAVDAGTPLVLHLEIIDDGPCCKYDLPDAGELRMGDAGTGTWSWTPSDSDKGTHIFRLWAWPYDGNDFVFSTIRWDVTVR